MILNLISSPRTISTALMYSFAQRNDTKVIDEPFYAYYLTKTNIRHPGFDEIVKSQPVDPFEVVEELNRIEVEHPFLFLKGMAHHLLEDFEFLLNWKNVILIRNPVQIISSFSRVIERPTLNDVGIKRQFELYQFLDGRGNIPIVVDSSEVLKDPQAGLVTLCGALGIPFDSNMLKWTPGPLREDGIWAKYWYHNVHHSSDFGTPKSEDFSIDTKFKSLLDEATPYFEYLSQKRLF